jgi:hypothetical protein
LVGCIVASFVLNLIVSAYWPDKTPTPSCGCFGEGGPWRCWVRDAGGSWVRLVSQWIAMFGYMALGFLASLMSDRRSVLIVAAVLLWVVWVLSGNLGLPHGGCLTIE